MDQKKFDEAVELFETATDEHGNKLNMHYLLVSQGDKQFLHRFNDRSEPSDVRSISKTVLALIAGIAMESHDDFDEDLPVWPILRQISTLQNQDNLDRLERLKVKHLLNHTIGYDQTLMMRGDITDLDPFTYVDHIINAPIVYEPGVHYLYSNAGFYLLSVILQEYLGEDLLTYADRVFFSKLGIEDYKWEKYGNYLAGATRLWLQPEDLLQVGELFLQDGGGLVSKQWAERLRQFTAYTPEVDTPTNPYFRRYAYASGLWLGEKPNIYFGHGTDGQTLAMIPDKNAVVITTAHQVDVKRLEEIVDHIIAGLH